MLRAVLFDIDDTIYAFAPSHKKALASVYESYRRHDGITLEEFENEFQRSWDLVKDSLKGKPSSANRILIFQNLVERKLKKFDAELILELYGLYWDNMLDDIKLFDGVIALFEFLKNANVKIALITDLTTVIQLKKISKLGISSYVDVFVGSEECNNNKPNPEIFNLAIRKLDVLPEDLVMVGDSSSKDIAGAKRLGINTIQVLGGYLAEQDSEPEKADYYIHNFHEIKGILENLL